MFEIGEFVKLKNCRVRPGKSKAFEAKFLGPFKIIIKQTGDLNYKLLAADGSTQVVHFNRMSHFNLREGIVADPDFIPVQPVRCGEAQVPVCESNFRSTRGSERLKSLAPVYYDYSTDEDVTVPETENVLAGGDDPEIQESGDGAEDAAEDAVEDAHEYSIEDAAENAAENTAEYVAEVLQGAAQEPEAVGPTVSVANPTLSEEASFTDVPDSPEDPGRSCSPYRAPSAVERTTPGRTANGKLKAQCEKCLYYYEAKHGLPVHRSKCKAIRTSPA